jgi:hypothetical protein
MSEKTVLFGLTKDELKKLQDYFFEKPAKEAIPFLQLLQSAKAIEVTFEKPMLPAVIENEPAGEDTPEEIIAPV